MNRLNFLNPGPIRNPNLGGDPGGLDMLGLQGSPDRHPTTAGNVNSNLRLNQKQADNSIVIHYSNIRGLSSNITSIQQHLEQHKPSLLFLSETKISPPTNSSHFHYPGYILHQNFRLHSGVCCYAKSTLSFSLFSKSSTSNFCFSWFKLSHSNKNTFFAIVYRSPNASIEPNLFEHLTDSIINIYNSHPDAELSLLGDFNVHNIEWLQFSSHTSEQGREAELFAATHNLTQLISEPTRVPDRLGDASHLLDLFLTNNPLKYTTSVTAPIGSSDHSLISVFFKTSSSTPCMDSVPVTHWHYQRADWDGFREFIASFPWSHFFTNDLTYTVNEITEIIRIGMDNYIPHTTYRKKMGSPNWFNAACSQAVEAKRRAYRNWKLDPTPQSHNYFNTVRKQTIAIIKLAKNNFLHKQTLKLINNPNDNKIFWSTVKNFNSNFYNSSVPPLTDSDNNVVSSSMGKANLLAKIFAANSTMPPPVNEPPILNLNSPPMPPFIISTGVVLKILRALDINKACGSDEIPPIVLKNCAPELAPILAKLFKLSLDLSEFPEPWKIANVHPIPKKGNHNDPSNYRPISLTSTISKVFETIVNFKLIKHLESNHLISDKQYGFRSGRSSGDLLSYVLHGWNEALDRHGETHAVALDISKAFDRVSHSLLISKLSAFGLSQNLVSWFSSFLSNRRIRVVLDGIQSQQYVINAGVPQGSVLASTLFLLHLNSIFNITVNPIHSYADDSTLDKTFSFKHPPTQPELALARANASQSLNSDLSLSKEWGVHNLVDFNASKTQAILISNRHNTPPSNISFDNKNVPFSPSIEILGITINSKLNWNDHVMSIAKKAASKMGVLYRAKHYFTDHQLLIIYKSHVRSQMEYNSHLFAGCGEGALNSLDSIQKQFIKLINNPSLTDSLPALSVRRDVSCLCLFYRYFHGNCSDEISSIMPPLSNPARRTRTSEAMHGFTVDVPFARTQKFYDSFLPRTCRLWNFLHPSTFPLNYNLQLFKSSVFKFLSSGNS